MTTQSLIDQYYASWTGEALDEAALRATLADDVTFRGSIDTSEGPDKVVEGVKMFLQMNSGVTFLAKLAQDDECMALFDCHTLPIGDLRCAEYLKIEGGKIKDIRLVFDSHKLRPIIEQARAH